MLIRCFFILAVCLKSFILSAQKEHQDYVPDSTTAMNIALAVWTPIYGKELIAKHTVYHAQLSEDKKIWKLFISKEGYSEGSDIEAEIVKYDGQIIKIIRGK